MASDSEFFRLFDGSFRDSPIWKSLMYSTHESSDMSNYEGSLVVKCDLFNPILSDMKHVDNLHYISEVSLAFEYWSPEPSVMAQDLFEKLQYLMTSFFLNVEFKYPFVFSYYGRRLFRLNYATNLRTVALLCTPLDHSHEPDRHQVLALVLRKLHNAILYEFNSLNIMKECDLKPHRAAACRKHKLSQKEGPSCSFKSTTYDLRIISSDFQ